MILREIKNIYVPVLQQIEYLEVNSDHQQYIDTEIKCSSNMTFDLNIYIPQYTAQAFWCFGGRDTKTHNKDSIHIAYLNDTDNQLKIWRYGNVECLQGGILGKGWHRFQNNSSGTLMIDNSINLVTRTSTFSTDINFYLLTLNLYNTPALANTVPGARIKQSKIYISNVLVRDFIPVRVGSVGYLYDRVSKRLFGNKGTGNFVLGQDVNSGLQQIYQNKLIEGEDYETADWLKGDGIINYDKPINYLSDNLRIKIRNLDSNSGYNTIWVGGDTNPGKNDWSRCIIDFEFVNGVSVRQVQWCEYVYRNGYYQHFPLSSDNIYTFDININRAIINGVTYSMTSSRCNVTTPFVITLRKADSIAYCKLNNVDMYPCQLLKPIPRNLDANNIARSAGDCGMIDLISGKFYGNVADSGTFTVENDNE